MESHYIMEGPMNGLTIRRFIQNFTNNQLPRALDSSSTLRMKDTPNIVLNKVKDKTKISIEEINTNSFLPTVLQQDKVSCIKILCNV